MNTDLEKIAQKNQAYYLAEKDADSSENHWFRYIKTMDAYSEPLMITPEMAKEVLDACEAGLRKPVDPKIIRDAAKQLEKTHPTIVFSFHGKLLDGRIVLETILLYKKTAIVFVSFNVSDKLSFLFR